VPAYDVADIESRLAAAAQSWTDDLRAALQPVPGLTTATLAFALGADTVAGTKHLRLAEAGAAVGLGAIPELRRQDYIRKGRPDSYYLRVGRLVTVVGVLVGIATAFIASGYNNIMSYVQLLFSFFNAPLFATFIIAMFWKRVSPMSAIAGLAAGTIGAGITHFWAYHLTHFYPGGVFDLTHKLINAQLANFYGAIVAFLLDAVVTVIVTFMGQPKPESELAAWSMASTIRTHLIRPRCPSRCGGSRPSCSALASGASSPYCP